LRREGEEAGFRRSNEDAIVASDARAAEYNPNGVNMAKAYWISSYQSISNPEALAEYAKLAGPAIMAGGGRFLARGVAEKAYEQAVKERTVLIEFDSLEQAVATYESEAYKKALDIVLTAAKRDVRIVGGV